LPPCTICNKSERLNWHDAFQGDLMYKDFMERTLAKFSI
jgi:hypothetical protein